MQRISLELGCKQYKVAVIGDLLGHQHSIKLSFVVPSSTGEAPVKVSKTFSIPVISHFNETVIGDIDLVGTFDTQKVSGTASLVSESGHTEHTLDISMPAQTLNCGPPRAGS